MLSSMDRLRQPVQVPKRPYRRQSGRKTIEKPSKNARPAALGYSNLYISGNLRSPSKSWISRVAPQNQPYAGDETGGAAHHQAIHESGPIGAHPSAPFWGAIQKLPDCPLYDARRINLSRPPLVVFSFS